MAPMNSVAQENGRQEPEPDESVPKGPLLSSPKEAKHQRDGIMCFFGRTTFLTSEISHQPAAWTRRPAPLPRWSKLYICIYRDRA